MAKKIVFTTFMLVTVAIVASILFSQNAIAQSDAVASGDVPMIDFKAYYSLVLDFGTACVG